MKRWGLFGCVMGCWLAACQPQKPADAPGIAPSQQQKPKEESGQEPLREAEEPPFKEDAVQALGALATFWALGLQGSSKNAPTSWHVHAASGTCMPKESGGFRVANERVYGPGDESVTLWDEKQKTEVTMYTYPATRALDAEFDDVLASMAQTCTEGPMVSAVQGDTHFGACVRRLEGDLLLIEQAVLFQRAKWLHKARITFAAPALGDSQDAAMSLLSQAFAPCNP